MATTFPTRTRRRRLQFPGWPLRIVLSGSMSSYGRMLRLQTELATSGVRAILPDSDDAMPLSMSSSQVVESKRSASKKHFTRIRDPRTVGILIVNLDKYGVHDYIGPNTFAEAAVAFASGRQIFLLQGIPQNYESELIAWGAVTLQGRLLPVVQAIGERERSSGQLQLFS